MSKGGHKLTTGVDQVIDALVTAGHLICGFVKCLHIVLDRLLDLRRIGDFVTQPFHKVMRKWTDCARPVAAQIQLSGLECV